MKPKFIDIHSHLDICKNINEIMAHAKEKDVLVVAAGVDHKSNSMLLNLDKEIETLRICMGIYPVEAEKLTDKEIEKEINFIKENKEKIKK